MMEIEITRKKQLDVSRMRNVRPSAVSGRFHIDWECATDVMTNPLPCATLRGCPHIFSLPICHSTYLFARHIFLLTARLALLAQ